MKASSFDLTPLHADLNLFEFHPGLRAVGQEIEPDADAFAGAHLDELYVVDQGLLLLYETYYSNRPSD